MKRFYLKMMVVLASLISVGCATQAPQTAKTLLDAKHPMLVSNTSDVVKMRLAITQPGLFQDEFNAIKSKVDAELDSPFEVPFPKDAGGGYTHEKHKQNYQVMNNAGILYQLTGDIRYAERVKDMLTAYADMYPKLGFHPEKKEQSPGRLFWQSLNEAVWLVYSIQAYDYIIPTLAAQEKAYIEENLFRKVALFLSEESPQTFNKVHNHGTWANAAVGMTGFVIDEPQWVEKALLGLDMSGDAGFLKQLQVLFSPDGYYNEGPYYQRYALMPFVLFAKAIEQNQPERKIFEYRDNIILKAINTAAQLSYNGLFFPINDAIKDKGIDTIELVYGASIAYGLTKDAGLLGLAKKQNQILLTGDGLKVAQGLQQNLAQPYDYQSMVLRDGSNGDEGALVIMRSNQAEDHQTLVFKATSQGLGHGHFDKLNWLFFDKGSEIIKDYGAARFLNIEAKYGGHYLAENNSYAKHTIAHNTLVVDGQSHFGGKVAKGNQHAPSLNFFSQSERVQIAKATMRDTYDGVVFDRTMALVTLDSGAPIVVDVLNVNSNKKHQYDLPVHYAGQFIDSTLAFSPQSKHLSPLGEQYGYQHLWNTGKAKSKQDLSQVTWLLNGRFYTHTSYTPETVDVLFTATGATDPNFNLIPERGFVTRVADQKRHQFVNVLEPHGLYNGVKEFTVDTHSQITKISATLVKDIQVIELVHKGIAYLVAFNINQVSNTMQQSFEWQGQRYQFQGQASVMKQSGK